jgi:hypothetical protein
MDYIALELPRQNLFAATQTTDSLLRCKNNRATISSLLSLGQASWNFPRITVGRVLQGVEAISLKKYNTPLGYYSID